MSFFGSLFGTDAAANDIKKAQQKNIVQSQQTQQQNNSLYQPYVQSGGQALNTQSNLLGLNGQGAQQTAYQNYSASPDFQVRFDNGLKALDRSALGKYGTGATGNGNVLKAITNYGQDQGQLGYNDYYSKLAGLGSQGLSAANGNASSNLGINSAITGAQTAIGNAGANAHLQEGGIMGGLLSAGTQLFAPGINNFASQLFKPNPVATTGNQSPLLMNNGGGSYMW